MTWRPRGERTRNSRRRRYGSTSSLSVSTATFMVAARASTPVGPPREDADERLEVAPVLLVEPLGVDFLHGEGIARDRQIDLPVGAGQGVVANPAQAGIGDAGRAPAACGELPGGLRRDASSAAWRR